jgi:very-short-patch-repair endonuclease
VFDTPGLRHGVRQRLLEVHGRRYRAELAHELERVIVELDGTGAHSTRVQHERDMQRDAAPATLGRVTIRLPHWRLDNDVEGCRRDLPAVLARRRRSNGGK